MSGENALSLADSLSFSLFFWVVALISLIPFVVNAIGLARICKKYGAFSPFWTWVWALFCPIVAVLRVGDLAAKWKNPYAYRKMFNMGIAAMITFTVLAFLSGLCAGACASFFKMEDNIWTINAFLGMLAFALSAMLAAVWMAIPLYISYFRIFKEYMPTRAAVLLMIGMAVLPEFSFVVFPILSFLPRYYPDITQAE